MKFVTPLTEAERITLLQARDQGSTAALRRRAQAVELSSRGYRLSTIAALLQRHRETVSGWLALWGPAKGYEACMISPAVGDRQYLRPTRQSKAVPRANSRPANCGKGRHA